MSVYLLLLIDLGEKTVCLQLPVKQNCFWLPKCIHMHITHTCTYPTQDAEVKASSKFTVALSNLPAEKPYKPKNNLLL